jgi:predicted transposase YbfD/YdcC
VETGFQVFCPLFLLCRFFSQPVTLSGLASFVTRSFGRHAKSQRANDLLTLLILAKLGGEDQMKGMAEWIRLREKTLIRLLEIPRTRLPHQTTYDRVLEGLDADAFDQTAGAYFAQLGADEEGWSINLDGKVLRGTIPAGQTQGTHLLAAYVPERGVVLMQIEVEGKTNEITAAPRLLDAVDLQGCVVTGDAMFTQQALCEQIVAAGGDYIFPVKDNQPTLRQAIMQVFMPAPVSPGHSRVDLPVHFAKTIDHGHGRTEFRYLTASSQLNDYVDWPHLEQVFRLQRVVQYHNTGQITYEVVFGIASQSVETCPPDRLLHFSRQHWHIENRLHYVRDVTFGEDACTVRHTKRQRLLASLNNIAIGLVRQTDFRYLPEARRYYAVHYDEALQLLL